MTVRNQVDHKALQSRPGHLLAGEAENATTGHPVALVGDPVARGWISGRSGSLFQKKSRHSDAGPAALPLNRNGPRLDHEGSGEILIGGHWGAIGGDRTRTTLSEPPNAANVGDP
jgi:hypothetical protein